MSLKRRQFSREFKQQVLREIEAGKSVAQAAREHQVHRNCIGQWQRLQRRSQNRRVGAAYWAAGGRDRFFEKSLDASRSAPDRQADWRRQMSVFLHGDQTPLRVARKCHLVGLKRASSYRLRTPAAPTEADADLRARIHQIALEMSCYGYRPILAELKRQGVQVGERRVRRLLREDNLLCLRKKRFVVTTDSDPGLPVYPNLAKALVLTDTDPLWRADITYIRLRSEFVYLAVILDAFSRRVIGWALERFVDTRLTMQALEMALGCRQIKDGLVHHSDRGGQYASTEYTNALKAAGIKISMSRRANPYDNAQAERFMRTLKYEEVYLRAYDTPSDARACLGQFIEQVYNGKRLYSALGYVPPIEFEQMYKQ